MAFAGAVFGVVLYFAIRAKFTVGNYRFMSLTSMAPDLVLLAVQIVVTIALLCYYVVGLWFLRTNKAADSTNSIRNSLFVNAFFICCVFLVSATDVAFVALNLPSSSIEMNEWMLLLVLGVLPMLTQTIALLVVVFFSWISGSKQRSPEELEKPLLTTSSKDNDVPLIYRV
jgi:hypothetical protein